MKMLDLFASFAAPVPAGTPQPNAGADSKFEIVINCTVLDRAWAARFYKPQHSSMSFKFDTSSIAIAQAATTTGAATGNSCGTDTGMPAPKVTAGILDTRGGRCPFCQASFFIRCSSCNRLVCEGRTITRPDGRFFRCSASCGAAGLLTTGGSDYEIASSLVDHKPAVPLLGGPSPGAKQLPATKYLTRRK